MSKGRLRARSQSSSVQPGAGTRASGVSAAGRGTMGSKATPWLA